MESTFREPDLEEKTFTKVREKKMREIIRFSWRRKI